MGDRIAIKMPLIQAQHVMEQLGCTERMRSWDVNPEAHSPAYVFHFLDENGLEMAYYPEFLGCLVILEESRPVQAGAFKREANTAQVKSHAPAG